MITITNVIQKIINFSHIYPRTLFISIMAVSGKSFDFRMSKKVAELTQVVHMLFTRNHEREVETEALRAAYEAEIEAVIQDARGKIRVLDTRIQDMERGHLAERDSAREELARRESQWQANIVELKQQLQDEKSESQNSRDLLIQAQRDLEQLRGVHGNAVHNKIEELKAKNLEVKNLRSVISDLEGRLKHALQQHNSKEELTHAHAQLRHDVDGLRRELHAVEQTRDSLSRDNKQMETDIRALRRELARASINATKRDPMEMKTADTMDYGEEMAKLQRELQRYRMELFNRENNFNRMFVGRQPVLVDQKAPQRGSSTLRMSRDLMPHGSGGLAQSGMAASLDSHGAMRVSRQKTFTEGFRHDLDQSELASSPRTLSSSKSTRPRTTHQRDFSQIAAGQGSEKLPLLSTDRGRRRQPLTKPRPLPRELLSAKSQAV